MVTEGTSGVVRTFSAAIDQADLERVRAIVAGEVLPALRQPGNTHLFACVGPPASESSLVEAFLFTAWESHEAMDRTMEQPATAVALTKLLGFVRAAASEQTYEIQALTEQGGSAVSDAPAASDGWVAELWGTVQAEMAARTDPLEENPYVRWFFLNTDDLPDFVAAARRHDADLTDRLLARYRESGRNGLDDVEPGVISPRSRTAQHLYYLVRAISRFGDISKAAVLDIGGGFGNLARVFLQLDACARCDVVDIGGITAMQEEYLQASLPSDGRYRVFNIEDDADREALAGRTYDLVISTFAITETPPAMRDWYIERVLLKARHVYVVGNEIWHEENVVDQLRERLSGSFTCEEDTFVYQSPNAVGRYVELFGSREPRGDT